MIFVELRGSWRPGDGKRSKDQAGGRGVRDSYNGFDNRCVLMAGILND
jgi:hypothetical protein